MLARTPEKGDKRSMKISNHIHRAVAATAALGAALALSACFESEQVITVKKDGSGTIEAKTILGAQMAGMIKMAQQQGGEEAAKDPLTDPAELKKQAAKMGEGVEFVKVEPLKFDDGRMGAVATFKFADIRRVKMVPGEGPNVGSEEAEGAGKEESPIRFGFTPGDNPKLTITMPPQKKEEAKAEAKKEGDDEAEPKVDEAAGDEAAMAMMAPMMQGMRVTMKVKVEGEITKTDATHKDGSTVTLMDLDMGKLFANKDVLKKMESPDDMKDFAKFAQIAKEAGATLEAKPEVSVEFK